ncbi:autotransporter protein [Helicobacter cholecystus]|nr:autotransporter outer membrane beta-barrel domain-containing protein [Helicobacter cholecystus]VEJ24390.1 autotransporter protein [Helicobacter cholecystus]
MKKVNFYSYRRQGGGDKLNPKYSLFKPIIASSLALALGVSVGSAQDHDRFGDITTVGEHNILKGPHYSGNITRPNTTGEMTVNVGTQSAVGFIGNIGGNGLGSPSTSDLIVNFLNGSTLTGNIETAANYFAANKVTFKSGNSSENFVLTGNIISYGRGYVGSSDTNKGNHITFHHGSMRGDVTANFIRNRGGYNNVVFDHATERQILKGNISVSRANTAVSENKITFNIGEITGNITSSGGSNNITFKQSGTTTGNIETNGGTNTLIFGSTSQQQASSSDIEVSKIIGDIKANRNGSNTITFNNAGSIQGTILAGSGGYEGSNTITFKGNATIGNALSEDASALSTNTSSLIANNASNGNTQKRNTLTFEGTTNHIVFNEVKTTGHGNTKNILLLKNNSGATSALTINKITTSGGINSIAKESFENTSEISSMDSKVFTGTLQIKQGIIGNNGGWTNIAFKAQNGSQTNSVISAGDNGNAIEGNANIYLDLSEANLNNQAIIDGNINGTGSMYLTLKGKNSSNSVGIQGNITTGQYTTKITLVDAGIQGKASQKAQEATGSNISVTQSSGKNIILATTSTNLNLGSVTALSGGVNSIAKADLSSINNNGFTFSPASTHSDNAQVRGVQRVDAQAADQSDIASKAMEGTLQIKNGVSANNGGWNNIAFRAGAGQSSPVIAKLKEVTPAEEEAELNQGVAHFLASDGKILELDTAVSGNANLYLDMSSVDSSFGQIPNQPSAFFANLADNVSLDPLSKSAILGHLDNLGGRQNIYIKGKGDNAGLTLGLTGNITNGNGSSGSMNIIFEDSLWTPYAVLKDGSGSATNAGGVVITNGSSAKTNLILRKSPSSAGGSTGAPGVAAIDTSTLSIPVYKVVSLKGETNIVMQGDIVASSYISYANGGNVNLLFANNNDNAADSFDASSATDITSNKVLGKTYKDGVKLALSDKQVSIGDTQKSFLETYGHYFSDTFKDGGLLNVTTARVNNGSSKTQTDTVHIQGLALGNISPLASSTAAASSRGVSSQDGSDSATTYNYNVVIGEHSAFVGDIKLQNDALIHLVMEDSSKLLTDVEHLKLKSLTLKSSGYNTNEMLLDTFAQNNTIIDIATMGDALGNLKERSNFRLLEIGDAPSSGAGAVQASSSTGLKGSGALFRVYVNANATQGADNAIQKEADAQVDAKNATLGGNSNSGGANGKYGYVYSDRIIIHDALSEGDASSGTVSSGATLASTNTNYIQTIYDANTDIAQLTYHGGGSEKQGNIAVATVKTSSGITFKGATQIQGFDEVGTTLTTANTDQYGKVVNSNGENQASGNSRVNAAAVAQEGDSANTADYTTYFISSVESKGASAANTLASTTALGLNYDLFLANFNSLNKRMGELRDNNHSQGAWGRIFNGMLSTSYGLQTKSIYTTLQAGYDYAFGFNEANNYLGFALSYANSIIKPKTMLDIDGNAKGIDKTNSNAVELAIYNSYVEDSGWFNDTIFKFSFIMSSINMAGQSSNYNTNNYGIVLSDEFGYRFKLGNESEWYIDPQVEFSLGYFNASNLKQVLSEASLNGTQDAIFNLRSRLGANFAYDLKRFTQGKDIKASVYVGTYYAYDYIKGGEISLTTNLNKTTQLKTLGSTGRFELNLGTNVEIKDNTRIYFDFERSFGGDITTEYQVNLGVRYSFGEKINYAPEVSKSSAPLKVESKEETQKSESKEQESAQSKEEQKQ